MLHAPALRCEFRQSNVPPPSIELTGAAAFVGQFLEQPDECLDYASAKVAFDTFVDPGADQAWAKGELDRLTDAALGLTLGHARPAVRLGAVRRVIYESGPWNDHRPFAYDQSDPQGRHLPNKLLHNYLRTRRGQCVSMPALFLILAERLGLNVALASAPEHVLVRYTDEAGRAHNLETTSGGHPARNEWLRDKFAITDRAIETGIYLRTLTKREGIGLLASTITEWLYRAARYREAMDLAALLLRNDTLNVTALLTLGSCAGKMLAEMRAKFPDHRVAPPQVAVEASMLMNSNQRCFARAENLGWAPFKETDNVR